MFCRACGIELPEHARFCRSCGKPIDASGVIRERRITEGASTSPVEADRSSSARNIGDKSARAISGNPRFWRMSLVSGGTGITAIALIAFIMALHNDRTRNAGVAVAPVAETSDLLDKRAGDCGDSVTFAATTIPKDVDVNRTMLCGFAREVTSRNDRITRDQLESLCQSVSESSGTSDFAALFEKYRDAANNADPAQRQMIAIIWECANKEQAIRRASAATTIRIYSVGRLTSGGSSCLGYIEELSGMKEAGGSISYFLYGTGNCSGQDFNDKNVVFHPEANPSGRPPGDVIRQKFAYTGELPKQWVYKGQSYPFGGERPVTSSKASVRVPMSTTAQTQSDSGTSFDEPKATEQPPLPVPPGAATAIPPVSRVADIAEVLTNEQGQRLANYSADLERQGVMQVAALLITSTGSEGIDAYSLRVARQWQLGRAGADDGALIVIAVKDRLIRLELGNGLASRIPQANRDAVVRVIAEHLGSGDYAGGIEAGIHELATVVVRAQYGAATPVTH